MRKFKPEKFLKSNENKALHPEKPYFPPFFNILYPKFNKFMHLFTAKPQSATISADSESPKTESAP